MMEKFRCDTALGNFRHFGRFVIHVGDTTVVLCEPNCCFSSAVAQQGLKHQVNAIGFMLSNDRLIVCAGVVDDYVCTERFDVVAVLGTGRGVDLGPQMLGHWNSDTADASGASLDKDGLPRLQAPEFTECLPGG